MIDVQNDIRLLQGWDNRKAGGMGGGGLLQGRATMAADGLMYHDHYYDHYDDYHDY